MSVRDAEAGRPILISFKELQGINVNLATINHKLDGLNEIPREMEKLEHRIIKLEEDRAVRNARGGLYDKVLSAVWALGLTIIGAGVFWPHISFGH